MNFDEVVQLAAEAKSAELIELIESPPITYEAFMADTRQHLQKILEVADIKGIELFPKQDSIETGKFGSLVKLSFQYNNRTITRNSIIGICVLFRFILLIGAIIALESIRNMCINMNIIVILPFP